MNKVSPGAECSLLCPPVIFYKKLKNLLTNSLKGGIIVNVAENNTDTTKTI